MRTMMLVVALLLAACSNEGPQWMPCDVGETASSRNTGVPYLQGDCPEGYACERGACTIRCRAYTWVVDMDGVGADDSHWESETIEGACDGIEPAAAGSARTICRTGCVIEACTYDSECPAPTLCVEGSCRIE